MKSSCCNADIVLCATNALSRDVCMKCGLPCSESPDSYGLTDLIKAYHLGYSDRNAKMSPFGDQDPKEYILSCLKNM